MHPVMGTGRLIAGRYRLHDPIGRGAMGVVWRGRDELLDRDVAVKEVQVSAHAAPADAEVIYQRTLREARTAARLSHPSVVKVFDVVEENGTPWIIMELIEARSLDQVITEDGPLTPDKAAELGKSLVSALATAHAAGVLHRDVKPSNVLVTKDGKAVLTDFGIATFAEDLGMTQAGMVVGTPGFTAPERIRGDIATPASDLWSVGATLYAAVEGRGPFDRVGGSSLISAGVASEDAPRAPSAGPLGPVIEALLGRDPAARPDATTAERLLAGAATEARTGPPPLGHGWLADASETASTEDVPAPSAGALGPDSGFLDPPDYEGLEIPPADEGSGSGDSAVASAALVAADAALGIGAGKPPPDPASGPALWGPVKGQGAGGQPASQLAGPSGPGKAGAGGSGGSGAAGGGTAAARPKRSSRTWRLMVAAAGIAAIVVAAVIGWNIFQHSGPASALGSSLPPGGLTTGTSANHSGSPTSGAKSKSGSPESGSGTGAHSPSPGGGPHASGRPSPQPSNRSQGGPSGSPSPHGSSSSSPTPSPTSDPTPTPTPSPGITLPPGWQWHRFSAAEMYTVAGFKIGMPDAWTQSVSGSVAYLVQSSRGFHLAVNLSYWLFAKPLRQAQYVESKAVVAHPYDFRVLVLQAVSFQSIGGYRTAAAAELKYSWKNIAGKSFTEEVILVTLPTSAGGQPYQFSLWASSGAFGPAYGVVQSALPTFRPLPG